MIEFLVNMMLTAVALSLLFVSTRALFCEMREDPMIAFFGGLLIVAMLAVLYGN